MSVSDDCEQKQRKRRLRNGIGVGLYVHVALLLIFQTSWTAATRLIPNNGLWESWFHAMDATWIITAIAIFIMTTLIASYLMGNSIISHGMRIHAGLVLILSFFAFLLFDTVNNTPFAVAIYFVSVYCIILQIFLWRRLGAPNAVDPGSTAKQR